MNGRSSVVATGVALSVLFAIAILAERQGAPRSPEDIVREDGHLSEVLGLLPEPQDDPSDRFARLELLRAASLSEAERNLLLRDASGPWRTWSDDWIRFEVPADPLLRIEAVGPEGGEQLRVVGSTMGTTDPTFERAYRITYGEEQPYGLILVSKNDWFDEGICLCGAVYWQSFLCADGNLLEFSLLENGTVKKAQALNGSRRAILFEWTHSALTNEAYTRLAASLRLLPPSERTPLQWHALSVERRGAEAGYGWLRPGMEESSVVGLLGNPARREGGRLVYVREERWEDGSGFWVKRRLSLSKGELGRFESEWHEEGELEPLRGSIGWAARLVDQGADALANLPDDDLRLIFSEFGRQGASEEENWDQWCRVVYRLAEAGYRDPESLALVERRFLEPGLNCHHARWVLVKYDSPRRMSLFPARVEFLLGDGATSRQRGSELDSLFKALPKEDASSLNQLRRAFVHTDLEVRKAAAWSLHRLPRSEAAETLRKLLDEPDRWVRSAAASQAGKIASPADLDWIEAAKGREADESIRKMLEETIVEIRPSAREVPPE